MYPHERSLVKQLSDKPFAIIGVNSDKDLKKIRETVKKKNITWRSFQNAQDYGKISTEWGVRGWPTIYIIDADGRIRYKQKRGKAMDRALETLLREMGQDVTIVHEEEKKKKEEAEKKEDRERDERDRKRG